MAEVLQHLGPDRRAEGTTNAAAAEELVGDDEEILRFMDSADGYLLLMDSLSAALRQVDHAGRCPLCTNNLSKSAAHKYVCSSALGFRGPWRIPLICGAV